MSPLPDSHRDENWRQYGHALDEYRFQVQLNWDRAKYLLTLDIGMITAATALFGLDGINVLLVGGVYFAGLLVSMLGMITLATQRSYYHSARELKRLLEEELDLGSHAVQTTPGMTGGASRRHGRFLSVHEVQMIVFAAIGVVHVGGMAAALG